MGKVTQNIKIVKNGKTREWVHTKIFENFNFKTNWEDGG